MASNKKWRTSTRSIHCWQLKTSAGGKSTPPSSSYSQPRAQPAQPGQPPAKPNPSPSRNRNRNRNPSDCHPRSRLARANELATAGQECPAHQRGNCFAWPDSCRFLGERGRLVRRHDALPCLRPSKSRPGDARCVSGQRSNAARPSHRRNSPGCRLPHTGGVQESCQVLCVMRRSSRVVKQKPDQEC